MAYTSEDLERMLHLALGRRGARLVSCHVTEHMAAWRIRAEYLGDSFTFDLDDRVLAVVALDTRAFWELIVSKVDGHLSVRTLSPDDFAWANEDTSTQTLEGSNAAQASSVGFVLKI